MSIRTPLPPGSDPLPDAGSFGRVSDPKGVSEALEAWFRVAARPLPWRNPRSGYRALVSEVMLQQTQVSRVIEAFERFVARFPGPAALAAAPEPEVLAAWQGLGYYRRARLLHAAARAIVERHGGEVPASAAELEALPGIGRYTAAAIASIVHGERVPLVDGNVTRVLCRLADAPGRMGEPATERWAWQQAASLARDCASPGVTNEALMELGATVCVPGTPDCGRCPVAHACAARAAGREAAVPLAKRPAKRRTLRWAVLVDAGADGILLERRPERGLWASMMQPPTVEGTEHDDPAALARTRCERFDAVGSFVHVTSHRDVEFWVFRARAPVSCAPGCEAPVRVAPGMLGAHALSNAAWRVLESAGVGVRTPRAARPAHRAGPNASTDS